MRAGGADPDARLRDMALDGVVAEVIYPTFGLFIDMIPAADLQMACAQVYNDWLAETFLHRPDVFIPSAVVPVRDVASAAAELERVVGLGFKAATIPTTPPDGTPYNQPVFDPLWKIAARRARSRCRCTPAPARCRSTSAGRAARSSTTPRSGCSRPRRSATSPRRACSNASPTCGSCSSRPAPAGSRTAANAWTRRSRSTSSGSTRSSTRPPSAYARTAVLRDARRRPGAAADARDHRRRSRCCGRATIRTRRERSPRASRWSSASSPACPKTRCEAIVHDNAARLYGVDRVTMRDQREHAQGQDRGRRRRRDAVLPARRVVAADADGARGQGGDRRARRRRASPSTTSTASRCTAWASTRRCSRSGSASPT